ncbi:hypothetical protein N7516_000403 [Penicillium verrucosum]|uniref:uncharacterized protein n=1 Tax=Penicillium verrucosum TaxID=60171 RepID=UPI00254559E1|nr:uncharacterized protein N7516_000403 [Penicillium verrucosum]KAJ5940235.1 hypothetical protein N7516_000403 [Penicillium verrucosum]
MWRSRNGAESAKMRKRWKPGAGGLKQRFSVTTSTSRSNEEWRLNLGPSYTATSQYRGGARGTRGGGRRGRGGSRGGRGSARGGDARGGTRVKLARVTPEMWRLRNGAESAKLPRRWKPGAAGSKRKSSESTSTYKSNAAWRRNLGPHTMPTEVVPVAVAVGGGAGDARGGSFHGADVGPAHYGVALLDANEDAGPEPPAAGRAGEEVGIEAAPAPKGPKPPTGDTNDFEIQMNFDE